MAKSPGTERQVTVVHAFGHHVRAGFHNAAIHPELRIELGFLITDIGVDIAKIQQFHLIDEVHLAPLVQVAVFYILILNIPAVGIHKDETISLIHDLQAGFHFRSLGTLVDLVLDKGNGVDAGTAEADKDVFFCHSVIVFYCYQLLHPSNPVFADSDVCIPGDDRMLMRAILDSDLKGRAFGHRYDIPRMFQRKEEGVISFHLNL